MPASKVEEVSDPATGTRLAREDESRYWIFLAVADRCDTY